MRNRLPGYGQGTMALAGLLCFLATGIVADEAASRGKEDRLPGRGDRREGSAIGIRLGDVGSPATCVVARTKDSAEQSVRLVVEDVKGTYAIPYIQSGRVLKACIEFNDPAVATVCLGLTDCEAKVALTRAVGSRSRGLATRLLHGPAFVAEFGGLEPGEYTLEVEGRDGEGRSKCRATYSPIGIGTIIAAIGDSITEGY